MGQTGLKWERKSFISAISTEISGYFARIQADAGKHVASPL